MEFSGIEAAILVVAAAFGVAVNTITGGGSLITLPVLLTLGIPLKQALAINMVALSIGGIGSVIGGLESLKKSSKENFWVLVPTAIGAAIGATLLIATPLEYLETIVPILVLVATLALFIPQRNYQLKYRHFLYYLAVLGVSIYGGYFGAGMGVMLIAVLAIFNTSELHTLNSLKNLQQVIINTISGAVLISSGLVLFVPTAMLVIGGVIGGYTTGKYLEKLSGANLRALIIAIGLILSVTLAARFWAL